MTYFERLENEKNEELQARKFIKSVEDDIKQRREREELKRRIGKRNRREYGAY